ncbi:hypothetical protein ACKWTF_011058 [Chironomus riparius]
MLYFFYIPLIINYGQYLVALSLPLGNPESNIFMSYNFEANYALPTNTTVFTQGIYDKILFINGVEKNETSSRMAGFNIFSRKQIYRMIEDKLEQFGINGRACLLRLICDVGRVDLRGINGVLGSMAHILFTPSSSTVESDMEDYIDAESSNNNCSKYRKNCQIKLLDSISEPK